MCLLSPFNVLRWQGPLWWQRIPKTSCLCWYIQMTLCARDGRCGWAARGSCWGLLGAKPRFADRFEWVVACQTQGKSGQVSGMETHWELLNTEEPSWAQEITELQIVRDREHGLNECPCVSALFLYLFQGVHFWHYGTDGSLVWATANVLLKKNYCRNDKKTKNSECLKQYICGFLPT